MQILSLDRVESTQTYLKELVLENKVSGSLAVVAKTQTDGVGSRDNSWMGLEGNLFLSFCIHVDDLPSDLKIESASIYFSYILKEVLKEFGSKVWIKWPNDFYIDDKKIGGMITNVLKEYLICGVGINIVNSPVNYSKLDIKISIDNLLNKYLKNVKKYYSCMHIFSKYNLEFYLNQKFYTHNNKLKISLENAELQNDGSIVVNGERIYSLR